MAPFYQRANELRQIVERQCSDHNTLTFEKEEHKVYEGYIKEYIEANDGKNTSRDPIVFNHRSKSRRNSTVEELKQTEIMQEISIDSHSRIPMLVGQEGMVSSVAIGKGSVLGEYYSKYILSHHLNQLSGTKTYNEINKYAFDSTVYNVKLTREQLKYFLSTDINASISRKRGRESKQEDDMEPVHKKQRLNNNESRSNNNHNNRNIEDVDEDLVDNDFNVVLDGISFKPKHKLLLLNDCRKDMEMASPTEDDDKYWNVEFVKVHHKGWPRIFAVARKEIEVDAELATFYGNYMDVMKEENELNQRNRKLKRVLRPYGLDHIVDELK